MHKLMVWGHTVINVPSEERHKGAADRKVLPILRVSRSLNFNER